MLTAVRYLLTCAVLVSLFKPHDGLAMDDDDFLLLTIPAIIAKTSNGTTPGDDTPPTNNADLCAGFTVNDKANRPMTPLALPAHLILTRYLAAKSLASPMPMQFLAG